MSECIGVTKMRELCNAKLKEDDEDQFCWRHKQQANISPKKLLEILNGIENEYKGCSMCDNWHCSEIKTCQPCTNKRKVQNDKNKKPKCIAFINPEKTKTCIRGKINDTNYCGSHQYILELTPEELVKSKVCNNKTCHRTFYDPDNPDAITCQICRNAGKKNRENIKEKDIRKMCKTPNCKNHENLELKNGYCGKCDGSKVAEIKNHNDQKVGKKLCARYGHNKNCSKYLNLDDKYDKCKSCREKGSEYDKNKQIKKVTKYEESVKNISDDELEKINLQRTKKNEEKILNNVSKKVCKLMNVNFDMDSDNESEIDETKKFICCIKCGQEYDLTHFSNVTTCELTKKCDVCREKEREQNKDRVRNPCNLDPEKLKANLARKVEKFKNRDTIKTLKYKLNRLTKENKKGREQYLKDNAEKAKKWRKEHEERMKEYNKMKNGDEEHRLKYYKYRAQKCGIQWDLRDDVAKEKFHSVCHYCGEIDENGLNGIDRKDNEKYYNHMSTITCCMTCNFMKGSHSYSDYLEIIKMIICNIVPCLDVYECKNSKGFMACEYSYYKNRAIKKEFEFTLTIEEFNILTLTNCYLCGKSSTGDNLNGVDRIDNSKGYTLNNCLSCCATCNYLKNKFNINDIFRKLLKTVYSKDNKLRETLLKHIDVNDQTILNNIVSEHLNYEVNNLKEIIEKLNDDNGDNNKNSIEMNNKPKKITKKAKDENDDFCNSEDEIDEKPKKATMKSNVTFSDNEEITGEISDDEPNFFSNNAENNNLVELDNNEISDDEKPKKVSNSNNINVLATDKRKELKKLKNLKTKENNIKKYGLEGYRKLESLRKQKQREEDLEKLKQIDDEINQIKSLNGVNPRKTKEEKEDERKEKDAERQRIKRAQEKEIFGQKIVDKWTKERQERRTKAKLKNNKQKESSDDEKSLEDD